MKCNIIEDLLPEYADGMCQPETAEEIEKHLKECNSCLEKFERMQKDTMENEYGRDGGYPAISKNFKSIKKKSNEKNCRRAGVSCGMCGIWHIDRGTDFSGTALSEL